jgi:glutathione peroxidase
MLVNCAVACEALAKHVPGDVPSSFYDIIETDFLGNEIIFDRFKGKVVYLINVASYCGYTAENYDMLRHLRQYRDRGLEIVIAPCNQVTTRIYQWKTYLIPIVY